MHRLDANARERRREWHSANEPGGRRIAKIEIDEIGCVGKRRPFSVRADVHRAVESLRARRRRLAFLLPGLPPFAGFFWMKGIADVDDHQDVPTETGIRR